MRHRRSRYIGRIGWFIVLVLRDLTERIVGSLVSVPVSHT